MAASADPKTNIMQSATKPLFINQQKCNAIKHFNAACYFVANRMAWKIGNQMYANTYISFANEAATSHLLSQIHNWQSKQTVNEMKMGANKNW